MLREIGAEPLQVVTGSAEAESTPANVRLDLAAQTLRNEVVARWGEMILLEATGLEDAAAALCDPHCLDARGVDHALDLRVDFEGQGMGLSVEDGIWLAEYLRGVGRRTGRFSSLVHRGQMAGKATGWRWVRYRGLGATMDLIHVSVCDVVEGEFLASGTEADNSAESWGIKAA